MTRQKKQNASLYSMTCFIYVETKKKEKRCVRNTRSYFSSLTKVYIPSGLRMTAAMEDLTQN